MASPLFAGTDVGFSSLCVSKEVVYQFVDGVIRELAAVSPSPYIHIGGDEALSTTLVDYVTFMERVMPIVSNYGKRVMGWNEITKAETVGDVSAQYWATGTSDFSIAAAVQRGAKVLMSPANKAYLGMKYDESTPYGLAWAGFIEVRTAYDWDPGAHLAGVPETAVLGVEAPLWSETGQSDRAGGVHDVPPIARASPRSPGHHRAPASGTTSASAWQPTAPAGRRWASPSAAHPRFPGRSTPTWRWAGGDGVQHRGCAVPRSAAVDGNSTTSWSSGYSTTSWSSGYSDPQLISIDLGSSQSIRRPSSIGKPHTPSHTRCRCPTTASGGATSTAPPPQTVVSIRCSSMGPGASCGFTSLNAPRTGVSLFGR